MSSKTIGRADGPFRARSGHHRFARLTDWWRDVHVPSLSYIFRPVRARKNSEIVTFWSRQPVVALLYVGRVGLHKDRHRSVWIGLQRLVLRAGRVTIELVRREDMVLVRENTPRRASCQQRSKERGSLPCCWSIAPIMRPCCRGASGSWLRNRWSAGACPLLPRAGRTHRAGPSGTFRDSGGRRG